MAGLCATVSQATPTSGTGLRAGRRRRLSAHLRFGEISARRAASAVDRAAAADPGLSGPAEKFLSELGWRDFAAALLYAHPDLARRPLRRAFERFPYRDDEPGFRAWRRGETGYPIVDAGMRQLWRTGAMHNRVRMIAASFLVKHLLIDWRRGEAWFWDTLTDADPASNPTNWQWVAGSGADAAPYFRIFNPVLQGETFDPDGAYVRRWVPELGRLDSAHVHAPWRAPGEALARAGVVLGKTYPRPIVDHAAARARALAAFEQMRAETAVEPGRNSRLRELFPVDHRNDQGERAGQKIDHRAELGRKRILLRLPGEEPVPRDHHEPDAPDQNRKEA